MDSVKFVGKEKPPLAFSMDNEYLLSNFQILEIMSITFFEREKSKE